METLLYITTPASIALACYIQRTIWRDWLHQIKAEAYWHGWVDSASGRMPTKQFLDPQVRQSREPKHHTGHENPMGSFFQPHGLPSGSVRDGGNQPER
jgi:hypothetical protein